MYIKKRASGNWMCQFRMDGKTRTVTAPTKKQAEYAALRMQMEGKMKAEEGLTVGEAIERYIESRDGILSPATIAGYQKILRNLPITDKHISSLDYQSFVNQLSKQINRRGKTMSPKSIANICGLIESSAKYCGYTLEATRPAPRKQIVSMLEPSEIFRLVSGSEIELPVLLAMWLSLSMSEIRGLTVESVNGNELTVRGAIVDVDGVPTYKESNKAYDRARTLRAPEKILDLIHQTDAWRKGEGFLVPLSGQAIYKRWMRAQNGTSMTFHQLRHLNASIMMTIGLPDTYAMERGGWTSRQTLNRVYQHTMASRRREYDDLIDRFFSDASVAENSAEK